jgi:hypothetical protein
MTIDDPNRGANKADIPGTAQEWPACPWLKAMNRTRVAWRAAGVHSFWKRFPMAFSPPSRCASSRLRCPDLEHLRGALSYEDHRAAFEGRREGNQAAGISHISGFAARRLAGQAAQLLRRLFP